MNTVNLSLYQGDALLRHMRSAGDVITSQVGSAIQNQRIRLQTLNARLEKAQAEAREAAKQLDRSENAELQNAFDDISQLMIQITDCSNTIAAYDRMRNIAPNGASGDVCSVGSVVCITDVDNHATWIIKLYPAGLGNAKIGAISIITPLGKALDGQRKGDSVVVRAPHNSITYRIEEVI